VKEIVNQSWAMDVNERMLYFIEFNDGSARQELLNYTSMDGKFREQLYEIDFAAGSDDADMCIKAARTKNRFTNEVFPTYA